MTIGRMVRKMMKMFLMSWIDILGGLGLGIIGGIIITFAVIYQGLGSRKKREPVLP